MASTYGITPNKNTPGRISPSGVTKRKKGTSENNLVNYREYSYDSLSQLVEEIHYDSTGTATKTTTYDYDEYGNILSRTENGQTVAYTYGTDSDAGWSMLLTSYNGQSIDYDAIGNPLSYRGATMTWTNGRNLASYAKDGVSISYTYDDSGMRTTKTVNGAKSEYLYVDGVLMGEIRDGHHIHYSYDSYGNLSVIKYYTNDTDYYIYYVMTNAQGDVISLHNANGATMVTYEYDAWGNLLSMTDTTGVGIGTINPFRYRGYYYDVETGLYYLSSRYYDPEVGRFISADAQISDVGNDLRGYNIYAYCFNNPLNMSDLFGNWPSWNDLWNGFNNFMGNVFGAGILRARRYEAAKVETVLWGAEDGPSSSGVVCGDISKPVSVYAEVASDWWKITEYKVGIQVNTENYSAFYATNGLESSIGLANDNSSVELAVGINKVAFTKQLNVNFDKRTAGWYEHWYFRTVPAIGVGTAVYYGCSVIASTCITLFGVGVVCAA